MIFSPSRQRLWEMDGGKTEQRDWRFANLDWFSSRYAVDANGQVGVVPPSHLEPIAQEVKQNFDLLQENEQPKAENVEQPIYDNTMPSTDWSAFASEPTVDSTTTQVSARSVIKPSLEFLLALE